MGTDFKCEEFQSVRANKYKPRKSTKYCISIHILVASREDKLEESKKHFWQSFIYNSPAL